jgi:hypothetical protein
VEVNGRFGEIYRLQVHGRIVRQARNLYEGYRKQSRKQQSLLATCFIWVSSLAYSSIPMIEAVCSSETSIKFNRSSWSFIPEDRSLHNHRSENLISNITMQIPIYQYYDSLFYFTCRDVLHFNFFLTLAPTLEHRADFSVSWSFTDGRTPRTGDQLVSRPLPNHRTTQTQKNAHTHQISIPWMG